MQKEYFYLAHYGIKGMRKGQRRFTNEDGTLNDAGKRRYGIGDGTQRAPAAVQPGVNVMKNLQKEIRGSHNALMKPFRYVSEGQAENKEAKADKNHAAFEKMKELAEDATGIRYSRRSVPSSSQVFKNISKTQPRLRPANIESNTSTTSNAKSTYNATAENEKNKALASRKNEPTTIDLTQKDARENVIDLNERTLYPAVVDKPKKDPADAIKKVGNAVADNTKRALKGDSVLTNPFRHFSEGQKENKSANEKRQHEAYKALSSMWNDMMKRPARVLTPAKLDKPNDKGHRFVSYRKDK